MKIIAYLFFISVLLASCRDTSTDSGAVENPTGTPVTITHIDNGPMQETIELSATSSFLVKTDIRSNSTGYLQTVKGEMGQYVSKGDILFIVKTKEAENIGNTINALDTSFHFNGTTQIRSGADGYITDIHFHPGDYVQEGDVLATISDASSFVFLLEIPYELKKYLPANGALQLELPDGEMINGNIKTAMPTVDAVSQTQQYQIAVHSNKMIPENLIAKVRIIKDSKDNAVSLPKSAVLTNEIQNAFWIMKLMNDSTAIKVPVQKGIETNDRVEIISPPLTADDKILLTGSYGLPDTAKVVIQQK